MTKRAFYKPTFPTVGFWSFYEFDQKQKNLFPMHHRQVYENDGDVTTTALEQLRVENSLMKFFFNYRQNQKHLFKKF